MKKVLITGIDSFTGKHLSSYLLNCGYDVYGTSSSQVGSKKYKCDITKKSDILAVLKVVEPSYLIHLSGISFPAHGTNEDFYKVNTIGTTNILDSFIQLKLTPKKIILASSATIYGNQNLEVLSENLCPKPANHYGVSKYAMECLSQNYELPILITRPFNYTGKGQADHFLIPKIIRHYKNREKVLELGNLQVVREFNDIEYVCEVYKRLLESEHINETVNIASNRGIKLLDIIDLMNKISEYKMKIEVNPLFVRSDEIKKLTGSKEKLVNLIGKIEQISFEETLKNMLNA